MDQRTTMADHFDVLIVGAGLSGIGAAHYLQSELPGKRYVILELSLIHISEPRD